MLWLQGPAAHNGVMSSLDAFIHDFEKKRTTEPASRVKEKKKSDWIAQRRDHAMPPVNKEDDLL